MKRIRVVVVVLMALVVLAGLLTPVARARPTSVPVPTGARWPVTATFALGGDDVATSCPTTRVCSAAAGGELVTTGDGGTTWTRVTAVLPPDVAAVVDLDCPTVRVCVVVTRLRDGGTAVLTGPGAGPFTRATTPDAGTATAVACATANRCVVVDGRTAWSTRDRGASWRASQLPRTAYSDQQVTCVTGTSACTVYGNNGLDQVVLTTRDDGRTWTVRDPGPFDGLYAMDCPTVDVCVAGGRSAGAATLRRTVDGGATWKAVAFPAQSNGIESISCADAASCVATGTALGYTPYVWATGNGTTWTAQAVTAVVTRPTPEVDCPAPGVCRIVGAGIAYVTDDGASWIDRSLPAALDGTRAVDCPRATTCVVVGTDARERPLGYVTTDGGVTWVVTPLPDGLGVPTAVDCVTGTTTCVVVGSVDPVGAGDETLRSARTTDLGATWRLGRQTSTVGHLYELSCGSTTTCLATGYGRRSRPLVWTTADGGVTWAAATTPDAFSVDDVACTGPTSCVLLADGPTAASVQTTDDLGATWRTSPLPLPDGDTTRYWALDCSGRTCLAVGGIAFQTGLVARSTDAGATWTRTAADARLADLDAVSCGSSGTCAATAFVYDGQGGGGPVAYGTVDGGATWSMHRLETGRAASSDVACAGIRCYVPQENGAGVPVVMAGRP